MRIRRLLAAVIFAVAVAGPIVELFDHWDHTFEDGNDIEGTCVVAALCFGIGVTIAAARARTSRPPELTARLVVVRPRITRRPHPLVTLQLFDPSPPVPLRV